jgi:hypothetical protein
MPLKRRIVTPGIIGINTAKVLLPVVALPSLEPPAASVPAEFALPVTKKIKPVPVPAGKLPASAAVSGVLLPEAVASRGLFPGKLAGAKIPKKVKEELLQRWSPENRETAMDLMMVERQAAVRKLNGIDHVAVAAKSYLCGIPIPLPMQYLFAQSVLALGTIYRIAGPTKSMKSTLLYEFFRWFYLHSGVSFLEETEHKYSQDWRRSIMRLPPGRERVHVDFADMQEDWHRALASNLNWARQKMDGTKDQPGPGRIIPVIAGIDSVDGVLAEETLGKIEGEGGSPDRAHPLEALKNTFWIKTIPPMLATYPMALVLIKHQKIGQTPQGMQEKKTTGGKTIDFFEGFQLDAKLEGTLESSIWMGKKIRLRCEKNSFGSDKREILTRCLWREKRLPDGEDGLPRWETEAFWDWEWATTAMLINSQMLEGPCKTRLTDIGFHIAAPKVSDWENLAWSKTVGVSEKAPIPWQEMGRRINADARLIKMLRGALGIAERPVLEQDYAKQLEAMREEVP